MSFLNDGSTIGSTTQAVMIKSVAEIGRETKIIGPPCESTSERRRFLLHQRTEQEAEYHRRGLAAEAKDIRPDHAARFLGPKSGGLAEAVVGAVGIEPTTSPV